MVLKSKKTAAALILLTITVAACGENPAKPERHPMDQREVDGCIAGLVNLVPDDAKRKTVCECTADAIQADRVYSGTRDEAYLEAHSAKLAQCRTDAGISETDPFGILDNGPTMKNEASGISGEPVDYNSNGSEFASDSDSTSDSEYAE